MIQFVKLNLRQDSDYYNDRFVAYDGDPKQARKANESTVDSLMQNS